MDIKRRPIFSFSDVFSYSCALFAQYCNGLENTLSLPEFRQRSPNHLVLAVIAPHLYTRIVHVNQFSIQIRNPNGINGRCYCTILYPQFLLRFLPLRYVAITSTKSQELSLFTYHGLADMFDPADLTIPCSDAELNFARL